MIWYFKGASLKDQLKMKLAFHFLDNPFAKGQPLWCA